jgi:hypothetical protein
MAFCPSDGIRCAFAPPLEKSLNPAKEFALRPRLSYGCSGSASESGAARGGAWSLLLPLAGAFLPSRSPTPFLFAAALGH